VSAHDPEESTRVDFIVENLAHIAELDQVKLAEDAGITHHGAGQGPLHSSDPFQFLALERLSAQRRLARVLPLVPMEIDS
jgi:hypothetical protein